MNKLTSLLILPLLAALLMADPCPPAKKFQRGLKRTPQHKILKALSDGSLKVFKPTGTTPTQIAMIGKNLSFWGNDVEGDCVSAQTAASIVCYTAYCGQEYDIDDATVQAFCTKYSACDGADLLTIMQAMQSDGMHQGSDTIKEGPCSIVDYSVESTLQAALAVGPVNTGIDANALPSGAGSGNGWWGVGGSPGQFSNEDHCVPLVGFGPAGWLCQQLGVPLPQGLPADKVMYLLFTWKSIGLVDHAWIMSTMAEAYVRQPSTVLNGKPIVPGPTPPPPTPPPAGNPTLTGVVATFSDGSTQTLGGNVGLTAAQLQAMTVQQLMDYISSQGKVKPPTPPVMPPPIPERSKPMPPAKPTSNTWRLSLPANAERYTPTRFTQSIYTVAGEGFLPHIDQVPIASIESKWHQSGGMAGISGVTSEKYRTLPTAPKTGIGDISVKTSFGTFQNNQGLKRTYADGSRFDDVLSYAGRVFEHRTREKRDGKWSSTVTFSDEQARPPDYHGLTQTCASCHDKAGTGNYGVGLVSGGDTVLSDPLPWALVRHEMPADAAAKVPAVPAIPSAKLDQDIKDALREWRAATDRVYQRR